MTKRNRKKDTGIATIKSTDSKGKTTTIEMQEAVRDAIQAHDWTQGPRGLPVSSKQAPNYDRMTTKELAAAGYNGFRINKLTLQVELWVLGRVRGHRRLQDVAKNPGVLANLHEEVFATTGTVIQVDVDRKVIKH